MPQQIVFPCPNCGATQSVDSDATSTTCQFCGATITVPEELRPKTPPMGAAAPAGSPAPNYSFGGATGQPMPAMPGLPGMFMNMDVTKLRAMAMAARAGNVDEAARLYQEAFGVTPDVAQQAAQLMAQHHHIVLSQVQTNFGGAPITQMGGAPMMSSPSGGVTYNLPSPTMAPPARPNTIGRGISSCFSLVIGLIIMGGIGIGVASIVFAADPGLWTSLTSGVAQATNQYPRVALSFGGKGTDPGQFTDPRSIAVDGNGNIYVGDYSDGRVQIFDAQGKYQSGWKIQSVKNPHLFALASGGGGNVYAVISGGLYRFDAATGAPVGKLSSSEDSFNDVAAQPGGGLAAPSLDDVVLFNSNGKVASTIKNAISNITGNPELGMRVAVDGGNNLFLLGTFNNAVFHYDANGQLVNHFGAEGSQAGEFDAPSAIAVDQQGEAVYVSDDKGIQVFAPDGRYLSLITVPQNGYVFGMAFDAQGALYAVTNDGIVYKFLLAAPAK